jgi:hypothetical protein
MRRLLFALALMPLVLCLGAAGPEGNLISNPGMEADADEDGRPDGWDVDAKIIERVGWLVPMKGKVLRHAGKAKDGKFSLAYSSSEPGVEGLAEDKLFSFRAWRDYYRPGKIDTFTPIACSGKVQVEPGAKYRLSAWTAAKDVPYLMIHLIQYTEGGAGPGLGDLLKPPGVKGISKSGTWEWEEWTLEWTCPERVTRVGFVPIIAESGPNRWVWIDAVAIEKIAEPEKKDGN